MRRSLYAVSLFFVSGALLSLEISLMRMLRVEGFGNFTFGAIALALAGFGASGTFICLFRDRLKGRELSLSFWAIPLFILTLGGGFLLSEHVRFDPLRIIWDPRQPFLLTLRYLFYTVPFIIGASVVVLAFSLLKTGRAYFFNLTGSALGIVILLCFLYLIPPERILLVPLVMAALGLVFIQLSAGRKLPSSRPWSPVGLLSAWVLAGAGFLLFFLGDIQVLPYKGKKLALNFPDARIVHTVYSPFGTLEVISSDLIRIAPGLSYAFQGELPEQHGLYIDGDQLGSIDRVTSPRSMDYLLYQAPSAAYALHDSPSVLIAGLGGGASVERAYRNGGLQIVVSEPNPHLAPLLQRTFRDFTGGMFNRERIGVTTEELRSLLSVSGRSWDVIDISGVAGSARTIGGIYSVDTNYLLTLEAFEEYLEALRPGGTLTVTLPLAYPPRNLLKLTALAGEALRRKGLDPRARIAALRSWSEGTVLVRREPFGDRDISCIRDYCDRMMFDLVYVPGIEEEDINRYNIVEGAVYARSAGRIIRGEDSFFREYYFTVSPPTDDRPYFFYFFRPAKMPFLFREMGREWLFVVEGGYIILAATFAATVALSALFILLPLAILRRRIRTSKARLLIYFSMIALSFMFIEILLMQVYARSVNNPLFSNSAVIASLLLFSGVGSFLSDRFTGDIQGPDSRFPEKASRPPRGISRSYAAKGRRVLLLLLIALTVLFAGVLLLYDPVSRGLVRAGVSLKITGGSLQIPLMVALTAPLGVIMGFFFPLGLASVKRADPYSLPWAWSVNGFFSVIASTGAVLVTSNIGILAAGAVPIAGYWIALLFFPDCR